ncbi:hypothetical protein OF83DRAFT_1235365 [Amylostereum chailletii]|nr:hypothetical protein OF83DRAFT_1235365 [Amylostereum chailletii]
MIPVILASLISVLPLVSGHASIWHPSMLGFNVTQQTYSYDNRPVAPLTYYTFDQWWMHGHLDHPPHPEDVFELPAGQNVTTEIGCNKGATSFFASSEGGDIRQGDNPCPNSPTSEFHTTGIDDVKGCALAIAYKDDFNAVEPEDFTVFSVNQTCVWTRFTDFSVPERMPACPNGKCICAWFWIHSIDSGGEQNYMTAFQCNITNPQSNVPLAKPQVPRRCGADPDFDKTLPVPGNCTYGAKQPFYWFQQERNNMFEGTYAPPYYLDLYGFLDGPQDDIFEDSYHGLPTPGPNQTVLPALKTVVQSQRLPIPDLHLLPSDFLSSVAAPELITSSFVASSSSAIASSVAIPASAPVSQSSMTSSSVVSSMASQSATSLSPSSALSSQTTPPAMPPAVVTETVVLTVTVPPTSVAAVLTAPTSSVSDVIKLSAAGTTTPGLNTTDSFAEFAGVEKQLDVNTADSATPHGESTPTQASGRTKRNPHSLATDIGSSTVVKQSFAERLGVGTYKRKREMHKRGLQGLWGI